MTDIHEHVPCVTCDGTADQQQADAAIDLLTGNQTLEALRTAANACDTEVRRAKEAIAQRRTDLQYPLGTRFVKWGHPYGRRDPRSLLEPVVTAVLGIFKRNSAGVFATFQQHGWQHPP